MAEQSPLTLADVNRLKDTLDESGLDPAVRFGIYRELYNRTGLPEMALQAEVASLRGPIGVGAGNGNAWGMALDPNYNVPLHAFSRDILGAELAVFQQALTPGGGGLESITNKHLADAALQVWQDKKLIDDFPGRAPMAAVVAMYDHDLAGAADILSGTNRRNIATALLGGLTTAGELYATEKMDPLHTGLIDPFGLDSGDVPFDDSRGPLPGANIGNRTWNFDFDGLGHDLRKLLVMIGNRLWSQPTSSINSQA